MNFSEATQYLLSLGHETLTIKLGLLNTELLLESLGNPQQQFAAVQIAGTNGKGSTAVMLDSICRAAGISTGLYTSPHLLSITERIKVNGQDISEAAFADLATAVRTAADKLVADGKLETLPTFFEHVTAIAMLAFKETVVDLAILETGLGGRLDATTAVRASVVGITPISLDHQQYLGNTLAQIAAEKAAIIRPGTAVIVSTQPEEARRVIIERCRESGVNPIWATEDVYEPDLNSGHTFRTENDVYERVKLGLRGTHQLSNAAAAIALAETLRSDHPAISHDAIVEGLQTAKHGGRLELFEGFSPREKNLHVLLDGAHNPAGAAALRAYLNETAGLRNTPITLVFGAMADKQLDQMAATLFPAAARLVLTAPTNPRAASVHDLHLLGKKYAPGLQAELTTDSSAAMQCAISLADTHNELVCVTGSLYLIGEVRQWLQVRYGVTGRFS
jgi:dihydrofolate synthase/folylpolyglutamate synthase